MIWLQGGAIPVDKIGQYIRAEIPDPNVEPRLHGIIVQHNLHECSELHCKHDDPHCLYCRRGFPKDFSDTDEISKDKSRIVYKRRAPANGGTTFYNKNKKKLFDNSHVVPYNAYLSLLFDCHINVEAVTSVGCIKVRVSYTIPTVSDTNRVVFVVVYFCTSTCSRYTDVIITDSHYPLY